MLLSEQEIAEQLRRFFKDAISDKYKSNSAFAKTHSFDKSDLSRFLKGDKDWQLFKIIRLMAALKVNFQLKTESIDHTDRGRLTFNIDFDPDDDEKFWKSLFNATK